MHSIEMLYKLMLKDSKNPVLASLIKELSDEEYEELQDKILQRKFEEFKKNVKISLLVPYFLYKKLKIKNVETIVLNENHSNGHIKGIKYYFQPNNEDNIYNAGLKLSSGNIIIFVHKPITSVTIRAIIRNHFNNSNLVQVENRFCSIKKLNALKIGLLDKNETIEEWAFRGTSKGLDVRYNKCQQ